MADNRHLEIYSDLLAAEGRSYEAQAKLSASLDDKAQKIAAVAAVFIAAAFGFLKHDDLVKLQDSYGKTAVWLLLVAVILLILTVIFCLRTMGLRRAPVGGPSPEAMGEAANVLFYFKPEEIDDELWIGYKENQLALWKQQNLRRSQMNQSKANTLRISQSVLLGAISIIAFNIVLTALLPTRTNDPSQISLEYKKLQDEYWRGYTDGLAEMESSYAASKAAPSTSARDSGRPSKRR